MAWVESVSPSFRARHDSDQAEHAARLLQALERLRDRLGEQFPRTVADITIVMHGSALSLMASNPLLAVRRTITSPAARPYVAGWVSRQELHVLTPRALDSRATSVRGSREMLARSAPALYARRVILENNHDMAHARLPGQLAAELRWAWLLEGCSRFLAGQTAHARPAVARRLREGRRPSFPPGIRDAPLLGGTVIDLLARERGERAVVSLSSHLHPQGPRAALAKAFRGTSLASVENEWRFQLAQLESDRRWD